VHWLEAIYNRRRPHSVIGMLSPVDYEERYRDRRAVAYRRCPPGRDKTRIVRKPVHVAAQTGSNSFLGGVRSLRIDRRLQSTY
jgi:hypothetical protein